MQMFFHSIPARGDSGAQEELNSFLRSHRVLTVRREFVAQGDNSYWALAVEYMESAVPLAQGSENRRGGKQRVDYKEVLSPADFTLFAKLRDWRKTVAEKEGVPVYAVLTNGQLASVATKRPSSIAQLREIEGIGEARAGKYGNALLSLLASATGPDSAQSTNGSDGTPAGVGTHVNKEVAPPTETP